MTPNSMTQSTRTAPLTAALSTPGTLLAVFGAAVAVRVALAGGQGAAARPAGLMFAAVLVVAAASARPRTFVTGRSVVIALVAAAALVVPAVLHVAATSAWSPSPAGPFLPWAAATAVVAGAEEAFLRGALYDAVKRRHSTDAAIVVAAIVFGLLHVPFYGWHALPLDLAVGVVLGVARATAGTWTAPALAHIGADLAGWWLL